MGSLTRPGPAEESLALLELLDVPGVGPRRAYRLLSTVGSARAALRSLGIARSRNHDSKTTAGDLRAVARSRLTTLDAAGVHIVSCTSRPYPDCLRHLHDPPPALFVRGRIELLGADAVAIVGARRATEGGRRAAGAIARALAGAGALVVSGLALGIDAAAHRGALESGVTGAVLGNGIDRVYPRSHERLAADILRRGLIVSEFPPGIPPRGHQFPRRNRVIAALSRAVVIVEAAVRSGALITADHALDLGREIFAVPGPIDRPTSAGTNALLRDGAGVVTSPHALVEQLGLGEGPRRGSVAHVEAHAGTRREAFTEAGAGVADRGGEAGRILAVLASGPASLDRVSAASGLDVARALALLTALELDGAVVQDAGMRYRRAG